MENASKALIIAGAILLAILIISLGLVVYNQASDTIGGINMDQQQIETFNNKFTPYQGSALSGAQVNALRQLVISVNGSEKTNGTYQYVAMTFDGNSWVGVTGDRGKSSASYTVASTSGAVTGKTYTVEIENSTETGLVSNIKVTTNAGS